MRVLLFAGFLGSGKTTLILAAARRVAEAGRKLAVIVNEIGEVGIDGAVLRAGDLEVKEIKAGCICCQIGVDLVRTLREIEQQFLPDLVIIEASGIATPEGVRDALRYYPADTAIDVEVITVVDPMRFEALYEVVTPLLEAQIVGADRVVITRQDEATSPDLEETERAVRLLAPTIPIHVVDATKDETLADVLVALIPYTAAAQDSGVRG